MPKAIAALLCAFLATPATAQIMPTSYSLPPGYVEIRPGVISSDARDIPPPPAPSTKREVARLEIANGVLDIADATSTCHLVSRGGMEQNPLLRVLIGKRPACWKVFAAKGASILGRRLIVRHMTKRGQYKPARTSLYVQAGITGVVVGLNVSKF